jgi:uncharacterized protein (DUF885 family)
MRVIPTPFALVLILLVCGAPARAEESVTALADEYIAGYYAWRPAAAVALGWHEFDGRSPDWSRASVERETARLQAWEKRLEAAPPATETNDERIDRKLLLASVQGELWSMTQESSFFRQPMTYANAADVNIYIARSWAPLPDRVRSLTAVLRQVPTLIAAGKENLAPVLARPFVELAMEIAKDSADFLGGDLVEAVKGVTEPAVRAPFDMANAQAIAALKDYANWLEGERLPSADGSYALGREKYVAMLQTSELIEFTPERILEIGTKALRREQETFAAAARIIDPTKKAQDVFQEIQRDHPTEQSLISDTSRNLETIRQFLIDHNIVTLPSELRAVVEPTPKYLRAMTFASMDTPGPFEMKANEAYYYVTPVEPEWPAAQKEEWLTAFNYYTTDIVSVHEAYPGHYVQFLHLNASAASKVRKIFGSYAYIEGWAHYCEQMLVDEGFGASDGLQKQSDPIRAAKFRLAQSDEALLRLCRLCVSLGLHTQGMTVDEATKFFRDNCYYEEKTARQEAMRGTYDPGYLYYSLGKMQILKLREDYRKQEGDAFSLQKFHDQMLDHGMPPIRLLREILLKEPAAWPEILK